MTKSTKRIAESAILRKIGFRITCTPFFAILFLLIFSCQEREVEKIVAQKGLIGLMPEQVTGIVTINFQKLTKLDFFDQMLNEIFTDKPGRTNKPFDNYADFVKQTGIDLKKDVDAVVLGMRHSPGRPVENQSDAVALLKLTYDKEKILQVLRRKGIQTEADIYRKITVYTYRDPQSKQPLMFAFLGKNTVALGAPAYVKRTIDVAKATAGSVLDAPGMQAYVGQLDMNAVVSFVSTLPDKARKAAREGKYKLDLSRVEAVTGYLDRGDKHWNAAIQLISSDTAENQKVANALNGIKFLLGAASDELAEFMNNVEITATEHGIKVGASFTDAFLEKLKDRQMKNGASSPQNSTAY